MEATWKYINLASVRISWQEGLLVLMYHAIETPPLRHRFRGLYVEAQKLRSQLQELKTNGHRFVTLSDWHQNRTNEQQVAVTFDDGFQNVWRQGLPVLRDLAVPAINYIVVDQIGGTNFWDRNNGAWTRPLMQQSEITEWLEAGHEIGSHTLTHPHLTSLPLAEARREIFESKDRLENLFGRPILHFCYPYGDWNEATRDLVGEAGYATACTTRRGFNRDETDPLALHRLFATHRSPWAVAIRRAMLKHSPMET